MNWYSIVIFLGWMVFVVYWFISAIGIKKSRYNNFWATSVWLRGVIILAVILLFPAKFFRGFSFLFGFHRVSQDPFVGIFGLCVFLAGMVLAFWARITIGKNWGQPMSIKEKPDLITSGPYARLRHPIYSGMILGMIGTAIAQGPQWLIPFIIATVYFLVSAKVEEKNMTALFPKEYPKYKKKTKMLIPFIY